MSEKILLVEDDRGLRDLLQDELETAGYRVVTAATAEAAQPLLTEHQIDAVISDLRLPGADGLSLVPAIQKCVPVPAILIMTAFGGVDEAVAALKAGVDDFLTKPVSLEHLLVTVSRLLETRRLRCEVRQYRQLLADRTFHGMFAAGTPMLRLFDQVRRVARAQGPVLILGESGTGKELVARAVHQESERKDKSFVAVNCGGLPGELMESELFGHTSGAFTGARNNRAGLFSQASGGTLLLDEIAELPLLLQAKLLRVLQDGEVRPVGSDTAHYVDVRILAATNKDLRSEVAEGRFREDLYFRLETFSLEIPPLRERGEDIERLANHFLGGLRAQRHERVRGFSDAAMACLRRYDFPGNVRELENAVERAMTFCDGDIIMPEHLPARICSGNNPPADDVVPLVLRELDMPNLPSIEELQRQYAAYVLNKTQGNKRRTAELLGITRRTLYRWLE